ncbi:RHS repeat-associated core domain-containing protein [Flavobacterium sp. KJJ]|uniref:RHS repeat-associated core domain-containing protein n=1 Tax=Flavobacterium sp. KJJ TaxID=1270193 RepID=UPI000492FC0A|nr:RHS repeat-associated core domain-containing protein [Flavobacterium sp. KJJ]
MSKLYFLLVFFSLSLFVNAQTLTGSSTEVGITDGQLSVSLSGASNYTVPIAVPSGINGVEPNIGLQYNSQGGNGIAGFGWNITGVSGITRVASTRYHDGTVDPVDFDSLDRFALDGMRLIVKTGTYGANETVYETENFSNLRITSYGVHSSGANYGPQYFKVEYPDGSIAYYGNSSDSRSITAWSITTWENSKGARISYEYSSSNNDVNISSIKYGTLSTTSPINEVLFSYIPRKRPEQSYIGGQSVLRNNLLNTIKILTNGIGYRNYVLGYDETYREYQRLTTITEKSGDNSKSYNPTVFTYGNLVNNGFVNLTPANLGLGNIDYQTTGNISGDFNGDGKTDVILYPLTTGNAKKKYLLYNDITASPDIINLGYQYNLDAAFEEIFPMTVLEGNNTSGFKLQTKQGWATVQQGVFTTYIFDGYGIVQQDQKTYTFPRFILDYQNECGGENPDLVANTSKKAAVQSGANLISYHFENDIPRSFVSGDFNGDGITDIVVVERSFTYPWTSGCTTYERDYDGGTTLFLNFDKRISTSFATESGSISITNDERIVVADFNGDGKSDLYIFGIGKVAVYSLNDNNQFIQLFQSPNIDADIVLNRPILMGDYNGDGKADFVIPTAIDQDSWNFYLSTGINFNKINGTIGIKYNQSQIKHYDDITTNNNNWTTSLNENTFIAGDFTGDGKTDILNQQNFTVESDNSGGPNPRPKGTPQATRFQIAMNLSFTESTAKFMATVNVSSTNAVKRYPIPIFANLDDANKNFKYSIISGSSINSLDFVWYNKFDVLLNKITTGNGVIETISYKPLDVSSKQGQYSVYFNSRNTENYPNIDILNDPNFFVVSLLERKSSASYKKKNFQYYGAVSNVEGLGFLGFRSTVTTNWYDSEDAIISTISKNDITLRGVNIENYTVLGMHDPLRVSENKIDSVIIKNNNYTVTETDNLVATQSITLKPNSWIKSGSTFSAKINEEANNSPNTPVEYIAKSRLSYESDVLPNKCFKIKNTIIKNYNGLDNTGSETYVNYDPYNNPIQTTIKIIEGAQTVHTTTGVITYENQTNGSAYYIGRLTGKSQVVTASGGTSSNEELYSYSNNLISEIKKKGDADTSEITENLFYDPFGNIIKKTLKAGADTRETSFEYDPTGRFLKKSIDVEKLTTSFEYNANGTLKSTINPLLQTTLYEYDSWFKKTKETDYLGYAVTFNYVNANGNTVLTKSGSDGSVEEETFDDLGRKTKTGVKNIMGTFSYISYLYDIYDRTIKVSDPYIGSSPSQWNETKYDVYGRVFQSVASTGKITDIDNSLNLTTKISDGTKNETYLKNAIGKIASMSDGSSTIDYTYSPNGNLSKINFGGIETKILYDGWGRKKELIDPSAGTFKYSYNDFGDLIKEENPNGITNYNLTSLGKLDTKTIKGNKTDSKTTYTYNSDKLLIKIKYEDLENKTNTITDYKYDTSKRISQKTETTPYAIFIKRYKYDALGRIEFENSTAKIGTSQSSKTIRNTYLNGVHYQILDSITSNVVWQTNLVNGRGQLLSAKSGPTTITKDYNNGFASQFKYYKTTPSANILTLNTSFNPAKENLISRTNNLFAWNENFDYDDKDRLTKFNNIQGVEEIQSYDDKGRITQNNLGSYNYIFQDKPYQNSSIELGQEATGYYLNREGMFNDSMEDRKGWSLGAYNTQCISYDNTKSFTGKNAVKINTAPSGVSISYVQSDVSMPINNVVDTEYTFSGWVYSDGPLGQLTLFEYNANESGYFSYVASKYTPILNTWTQIEMTVLVPASVKSLRLRLDVMGSGSVWFDDVKIRKTSNPVAANRLLDISYNTFKSPVQIEETGVDKVSFVYNDDSQRSAMFYGSLQDKLERPLRKHYSADGTMEIKENKTTGQFEFVTYVGGDGYSAPAVFKSDGINSGNYLYLQRDYQGTILAVTDESGIIVEKRLFDAWGDILKVQDGAGNVLSGLTILDRGYTGHEHIQSVGIINMNGRLYDPKLRRFLQPDNNIQDPFNPQNYNRYGYVLNNPLKYTDQSGEFWNFVAGFLFSAYVHGGASSGEANPFKWNLNTWMSAFSSTGSGVASSYATGATNSYIDSYNNKPALGASAISSGDITGESILGFFPKVNNAFESGLNDRVIEVSNFVDYQAGDPVYWYNTMSSFKSDILNGRSLFFNASKDYQREIYNNITNMSIYDWSYAAGYSAPDIAVSLAAPYLAESIATRIGGIEVNVFRVYGGGSSEFGKSYSLINPKYIPNYRNLAGLPNVNTGEYLLKGTIQLRDINIGRWFAAPLDGNTGGLPLELYQRYDQLNNPMKPKLKKPF